MGVRPPSIASSRIKEESKTFYQNNIECFVYSIFSETFYSKDILVCNIPCNSVRQKILDTFLKFSLLFGHQNASIWENFYMANLCLSF